MSGLLVNQKLEMPAVYCGTPAAILLDDKKGSIGNKVDCMGSQLKNDVYSGVKTAAVVGTVYAASKSSVAQKY